MYKMRSVIGFVTFSVLWILAESCTTPLGQTSQCISIYDCQPLRTAFEQRPLPSSIVSFLRQSQCGFEGYVPRVCCGPLPTQTQRPTQRPTASAPTQTVSSGTDPASQEDASPAPRGTCGIDSNGDRIYGGQFTDLDEFPWMALLGYRPRRGGALTYQCGGVLINHRYVLTAAHCVVGAIETDVGSLETVRLGEYDTQTSIDCIDNTCADAPQEISVQSTHPNAGYSDKNKNRKDDIALVRMAKRAKMSFFVKPICLPASNTRLAAQTDVYVAGWGQTLSGKSSPVKLKLGLPVYDKDTCASKYRALGASLTDKQVCAGGVFAEDTCRGDSGGPLMRRSPDGIWECVAVVSFGYGCGRDGWPGVYTNVASYMDWIESTMRSSNN